MKLLTRQEYNLILRALDYYEFRMTKRDNEIREDLEDKLYYNLYNPKDGVAQTTTELPDLNIDLSKLNNVHSMKDYSH